MRKSIPALLATASITLASQNVFSVHDDLLAFPQYEVLFSDDFHSKEEAYFIVNHPYSPVRFSGNKEDFKSIQSSQHPIQDDSPDHESEPPKQTHELMYLHDEPYVCTIPVVSLPPRNETSEAEARAAEQKELARATDRGWELLQDLENNCLYFVSGWWSYSFCYNKEITQFHQLPAQPGKAAFPPQPDPSAQEFVLGRAKTSPKSKSKEDEWGNQIEAHTAPKNGESPKTELQVKGDMRYLVQKMEGGTICDLTGKPRQVEVQFHCNPNVKDRIGYIKEMTTCSYLMVVYTPRLCDDVAFMPPKAEKANSVVCKRIIHYPPSSQIDPNFITSSPSLSYPKNPIVIGGVTVGADFGDGDNGSRTEVIARGKSKAQGGKVEVISPKSLELMDLDPKMIEKLQEEVKKLAGDKGWKIEVVDVPGQVREILGIVEDDGGQGHQKGPGKPIEGNPRRIVTRKIIMYMKMKIVKKVARRYSRMNYEAPYLLFK
ncbi:putative misfolded glycoproteins degradation protein [Botrytis fragariae]|uniref:Endoplasmic reticulum lectin n=1 Tax=Botrytis fragariae TaxID=1964551 RepID=A0A8H6AQV4_9HELO|nr:putative misfolded glycoproteins degradation protein [Botrytis fragariae]KAF5871819.1 putative misfolded glycoproteins degradation protein [Botrytis fragariae]